MFQRCYLERYRHELHGRYLFYVHSTDIARREKNQKRNDSIYLSVWVCFLIIIIVQHTNTLNVCDVRLSIFMCLFCGCVAMAVVVVLYLCSNNLYMRIVLIPPEPVAYCLPCGRGYTPMPEYSAINFHLELYIFFSLPYSSTITTTISSCKISHSIGTRSIYPTEFPIYLPISICAYNLCIENRCSNAYSVA